MTTLQSVEAADIFLKLHLHPKFVDIYPVENFDNLLDQFFFADIFVFAVVVPRTTAPVVDISMVPPSLRLLISLQR